MALWFIHVEALGQVLLDWRKEVVSALFSFTCIGAFMDRFNDLVVLIFILKENRGSLIALCVCSFRNL